MNTTYVPYGAEGARGAANQAAQDRNAATLGVQSDASRAAAKATVLYANPSWDLVDAAGASDFELAELEEADLPEDMRSMTPAERRDHIDSRRQARAAIQKKILTVNAERQRHLKAERRKRGSGPASLDDAMRRAIRDQAARKKFTFNDEPTEEPQSPE